MSVTELQPGATSSAAEAPGMTEADNIAAAGYEVGNTLGAGFFAKVVEVKHIASGRRLAAKVIDAESLEDDDEAVEALHVEIDAMRAARHPNVVELHEVVATPEAVYLVMEKLEGGELFERVQEHGALDEAQARHILAQLLQAAAHCHEKGLVHRDLKLENVLFDSQEPMARVKLIDFGYAAWLPESRKVGGLAGTPDYVAPEVITWYGSEEEDDGDEYGVEVDIWSIGVILYVLLSGHPPFSGEDEDQLVDQVRRGAVEYPPSVWDHISPEAKDLVSRCLSKSPTLRPTAQEALRHPWVRLGAGELPTEQDAQQRIGDSATPDREASSLNAERPAGDETPASMPSSTAALLKTAAQEEVGLLPAVIADAADDEFPAKEPAPQPMRQNDAKIELAPLPVAEPEDSFDRTRGSSASEEQQPTGASPVHSCRLSESMPTGAGVPDPASQQGVAAAAADPKAAVVEEASATPEERSAAALVRRPTCDEPTSAPLSVIRAAPSSTDSTFLAEASASSLLAEQPCGNEELHTRIESVRRCCNAGPESLNSQVSLEGTSGACAKTSHGSLPVPPAPLKMSLNGPAASFEVLSSFQVPERPDGVLMTVDASTFQELYRLCDLRLAGSMEPHGEDAFAQLVHDLPLLCKVVDSGPSGDVSSGGA